MDFKYFLSVVGLVLLIEGTPYFLFPKKLKKYLAQIVNISDSCLRLFGLLIMLGGLVMLYLSKR